MSTSPKLFVISKVILCLPQGVLRLVECSCAADLKLDPQGMSRESFPLPIDLQQRLKALAHDCYSGRGFAVLRGLRSEDFTEAENVLIFGGIASHVAPVRGFQDLKRETVTCRNAESSDI